MLLLVKILCNFLWCNQFVIDSDFKKKIDLANYLKYELLGFGILVQIKRIENQEKKLGYNYSIKLLAIAQDKSSICSFIFPEFCNTIVL